MHKGYPFEAGLKRENCDVRGDLPNDKKVKIYNKKPPTAGGF